MSLAVKPRQTLLLMYAVLDKDTMKSEILLHLPVAKRGYASKSNLLKAFQCILYKLKKSLQWHIMRKKSRLLFYVSYVLMSEWAYLCQNTIRRTINPFTCQPVNFCKFFSKKFNTKSGLFIHQLPTLPQKIDSREGLFRCRKGLACPCGRMNIY